MKHFGSLKELINTLNWSKDLLSDMFEKRKSYLYKYDQALELLESEDKLNTLINKEIINQNGAFIDLDENFLEFFEQILEVNEEVNTSYIQEIIKQIKQNIFYYLQENNENRKYGYLKIVKNQLRKVGRITIRNVVDLNRNIENAFKTEPNYKIKISKLEAFDEKRRMLTVLIEQTEVVTTEQDSHFFKAALDDELKMIVTRLRQQLTESRHNLIETQKQIIEYLNQVKHQSTFIEKIKQVKYLKDQFELKAKSNLIELLQDRNILCFEPKPSYRFKINLSKLHTDEGAQLIEKAQSRLKKPNKNKLPVAESIAADSLQALTENEIFINLKAIRDSFKASGNNLFDFIMTYKYPRDVSYEEKITIFCQMASMYETEFEVKETFKQDGKVEYAIVYPGK